MADISLCAKVGDVDGICKKCRRNPVNTKPNEPQQWWIEPDWLDSMGDYGCMDFWEISTKRKRRKKC
jgi:hypothetical protein